MNLVAETNRELEQQNLVLEAINMLLESQVQKLQDQSEKDQQRRELEQQNQFLEQVNEFILDNNQKSLDNIFSIVSHELRTPLVPIKAYTKMILEGKFGPVNQEQISKLDNIAKNVKTLEKIIESSIESKKIEMNLFVPKLEKHDINKIFEDVIKELEAQLVEKNIKITMPNTRYFVTCDHDLIKHMFEHLVKNAISSISQHGNITLSIEQASSETLIKISDDGCGMPEGQIHKLFSKFHQIDISSTREKGGLGMGLYFCKQAAKLHGGQISIQSKEGKGTTVSVTIIT